MRLRGPGHRRPGPGVAAAAARPVRAGEPHLPVVPGLPGVRACWLCGRRPGDRRVPDLPRGPHSGGHHRGGLGPRPCDSQPGSGWQPQQVQRTDDGEGLALVAANAAAFRGSADAGREAGSPPLLRQPWRLRGHSTPTSGSA